MSTNIEMQHKLEDGSYDLLLPKSESKLITIDNTELNSHLGDTSTLEGNLEYLSRLYAYWWKRDVKTPVYTRKMGDKYTNGDGYKITTIGTKYNYNDMSGSFYIYYGDSLDFQSDGTPYISDQVNCKVEWIWESSRTDPEFTFSPSGRQDYHTYWNLDGYVCTRSNFSSANFGYNTGSYRTCDVYISYNYVMYKVSSSVSSYNMTTDYVYSFDRNANPDSGTTGNYTWTYKGIPFWNAVKDYISTD